MAEINGARSIIMGSIRLILFNTLLIYLLVQVILFGLIVFSNKPIMSGQIMGEGPKFIDFFEMFFLLCVAVLGCYGAFFKHVPSLKTFALLAAISGCYYIICAGAMGNQDDYMDYELKFNESMKNYTWSEKPFNGDNSIANKHVDILQVLGCCGHTDARDWNQFRPSSALPEQLPATCCWTLKDLTSGPSPKETDRECTLTTNYTRRIGCKKLIDNFVRSALIGIVFYALFIIFLSLAAMVVATNLEPYPSPSIMFTHDTNKA